MVFLLSVCGPPAPRIEEPFDGEDYTGNRCSQRFVLDPFYPAGLALILRTPTEFGPKSPVFWHGTPGAGTKPGAAGSDDSYRCRRWGGTSSSRWSSAKLIGLIKCRSKPASRARRWSSSCPEPETAISPALAVAGSCRSAAATP